jgi:hypothetical protein
MFISLICLLHLQAMFNYEMDLSSYFTCLHVLELLLFIAAIITYDIYLSYMPVLFGIRIFNLFKYEGSMSLVSLILQHMVWKSLLARSMCHRCCCYTLRLCCSSALLSYPTPHFQVHVCRLYIVGHAHHRH